MNSTGHKITYPLIPIAHFDSRSRFARFLRASSSQPARIAPARYSLTASIGMVQEGTIREIPLVVPGVWRYRKNQRSFNERAIAI